jgi:hypothetical protein
MTRATRAQPGFRMEDGDQLNEWLGQPKIDSNPGLTALAGGGQAGATQLKLGSNELATVASAADSVQLPSADGNSVVVLRNNGANAAQVFGKSGFTDTIDGTAGATGISVSNAKTVVFFSVDVGKWVSLLGA